MKPSLCLNMIVKNEAARIERCLRSVLPYVKAVAILDTGSTDDTEEIIRRLCVEHAVRFEITRHEFVNYADARNRAWRAAKNFVLSASGTFCQFALLMDADMELVVKEPDDLLNLDANAPAYDMMQKSGPISYANRRLLNLNLNNDDPYVGVTHEYIDVPAAGMITGAAFIDHADGANRPDKYPRDAALLEGEMNGRYLYYLANTYRDWGMQQKAIDAYRLRISLGGWDEEAHSAMMHLAGCYKAIGKDADFVTTMIEAYNFRPSRAEPLYDLAKYYREKGNNAASLVFSKQGIGLTRPDDTLFVNDFVYDHGLRYEYSVAGYYDPKERSRAFQVTDDLALDPTCPHTERWSARSNLYWHTKPLREYCPSFRDHRVHIPLPDGYTAMNPSVEVCNGHIYCNIRAVNYKIDEHGRYMIGPKECHDAPIETRNFVCTMDDQFGVHYIREIIWDRPQAKFPMVIGLEDVRLYRDKGEQWFSACIREQASNGTCQQIRGRLVFDSDNRYLFVSDSLIMSGEDAVEKNWMPILSGGHDFMYRLDRIVHTAAGGNETKHPTKLHVGDISGSSQLIPFRAGYIAVTHEAAEGPDGKRTYWHRFAWFGPDYELRRLSLPFVFLDKQIEFCAGIAYHPNNKDLILSFGVRDAEAHLATVSVEEVAHMVWKFDES